MSRRRRAAFAVALLAGGVFLLWLGTRPPSSEAREANADAIVDGIATRVTVEASGLLATRAIADFGVGEDVRLVLVRIVDELRVEIRIDSPTEVVLAGPIRACLVGPDAAPDDAGLEDRCWGDAELGPLIEAQLPRDDQGRIRLAANDPLTVRAILHRGEVRCDYPPGTWHSELLVDPIVDGSPAGPRYAPEATFEVPFVLDEALTLVQERRYCGLASKVYREQGEPVIAEG